MTFQFQCTADSEKRYETYGLHDGVSARMSLRALRLPAAVTVKD
jgi:hypothetical protein